MTKVYIFLDKEYLVNGEMFEAEDFDEPPADEQTQGTERDEINKPAEDGYGIFLNFFFSVFK